MGKDNIKDNCAENEKNNNKVFGIAISVLIMVGAIFVTLIILAIAHISDGNTSDSLKNIKDLFGILLPVISTWVGIVLTFYFSKDNFKSANDSVQQMVNQVTSLDQKLQIKVSDIMYTAKDGFLKLVDDEKAFKDLDLSQLKADLRNSKSERMPVLQNKTLKFIFLLYLTTIERFIDGFNDGSIKLIDTSITDPKTLKVKHMYESDFTLMKDLITLTSKNNFLSNTATLDDARKIMQEIKDCQDVFITKTGNKDEAVEGWITNELVIEKTELFKKAGTK